MQIIQDTDWAQQNVKKHKVAAEFENAIRRSCLLLLIRVPAHERQEDSTTEQIPHSSPLLSRTERKRCSVSAKVQSESEKVKKGDDIGKRAGSTMRT